MTCGWCRSSAWKEHCQPNRCRWFTRKACGSVVDLDQLLLLPPRESGQGPIPVK